MNNKTASRISLTATLFGVLVLSAVNCSELNAQSLKYDYAGPVQYSPDDPWVRGKIFQIHTNHAGWFYNCDHQEDKRYSPYINWNRQPCYTKPKDHWKWDIHNQISEVKRRICWGKGDCGHKTDRLPPDPSNAQPVVEEFEVLGHESLDGGFIEQSTIHENYSGNNYRQPVQQQRAGSRTRNREYMRNWVSPVVSPASTSEERGSSRYLVPDPGK